MKKEKYKTENFNAMIVMAMVFSFLGMLYTIYKDSLASFFSFAILFVILIFFLRLFNELQDIKKLKENKK